MRVYAAAFEPEEIGELYNLTSWEAPGNSNNGASVNQETLLYHSDFSQGLPAGWSVVDGDSDGTTWTIDNPAHRSSLNWDGGFVIVDSSDAGEAEMDEALISPSVDCSDYEHVTLRFDHHFRGDDEEIADVDVRLDRGAWRNVARYEGDETAGHVELDISSLAADRRDVQVRWHYYDAQDAGYWGIDNVELSGR